MNDNEHIGIAQTDLGPIGSSFDDFLAEEGILEETTTRAAKAVFAWQLDQALQSSGTSKSEFARLLGTSRSQVDRLLDPDNDAVTIETLSKAAAVLGGRVRLEYVAPEASETAERSEVTTGPRR